MTHQILKLPWMNSLRRLMKFVSKSGKLVFLGFVIINDNRFSTTFNDPTIARKPNVSTGSIIAIVILCLNKLIPLKWLRVLLVNKFKGYENNLLAQRGVENSYTFLVKTLFIAVKFIRHRKFFQREEHRNDYNNSPDIKEEGDEILFLNNRLDGEYNLRVNCLLSVPTIARLDYCSTRLLLENTPTFQLLLGLAQCHKNIKIEFRNVNKKHNMSVSFSPLFKSPGECTCFNANSLLYLFIPDNALQNKKQSTDNRIKNVVLDPSPLCTQKIKDINIYNLNLINLINKTETARWFILSLRAVRYKNKIQANFVDIYNVDKSGNKGFGNKEYG
jgi:hypothetical protein